VVPLADDEGLVWQLVLTLDDVTEETRAREELQAANAELSRLTDQLRSLTMELAQAEDRERKRLSEILHDELQQLLTGARYQLGALARQAGADSPSAEALQRVEELIETSAAKARALSHELRPAVLEQADLGPALEWLAADLEEKHGLKARVEVRGEERPELAAGIKVFLFKAARELLFNVVKHSGGSDAWVMLRKSRDRIELTVRDEGDGFSPQSLGQPGRAGTGFGLFGIRERLRLLGGSMNVESAPGRGVIVELQLPRGPVPATERSAPRGEELAPVEEGAGTPAASVTEAGPIRVLLADDHPDARQGLDALLAEHDDVEVVGEAENGRDVIELARRLKPDVILMDLSMPILDGISATEAIKREHPAMRVVGLSMYGETDLARRMVGAGAETCLSKTDAPETILEALRGGPEGPRS
jgi:CheY-like chemotaxis protein/two-component sensor histidine kinase